MKEKLFRLILIIAVSCLPLTIYADEVIGFINGVVVNSLTNEPIRDELKIEVLSDKGETIVSTNSRIEGRRSVFSTGMYSNGKYKLLITHEDYDSTYLDFEFNKNKKWVLPLGVINVRKLTRAEKGVKLGEVTVTATKLKFYNKGDTIVYDADAFELSSGSMLDGLVSQLPGAELRDDGRIYVNGRFVENLLLNGRDFFKGENKVMLENLPAYMIKNVQVYEKDSEATKVAGMKMDEGTYVMDVQLKKDHQAGWLANAEAGGGTKERYMGRAFGLRFSPSSRVSVFGNVNNINDTRKPGRNGDWSPADLTNGLATTKNGGIDYSLFNKEDTYEVNGNVQATYTDGLYDAYSNIQTFLSSGDTYGCLWNTNTNKNLRLSTHHEAKYYLDQSGNNDRSLVRGSVYANYTKINNRSEAVNGLFDSEPSDYESLRDSIYLNHLVTMPWVNTSVSNSTRKGEDLNIGGAFTLYSFMFGNDDALSLQGNGTYSKSSGNMHDDYLIRFREAPIDRSQRLNKTPTHSYNYTLGVNYFMAPSKAWRIRPKYSFRQKYTNSVNDWYRSDDETYSHSTLVLPSMGRASAGLFDIENSYNLGVHTFEHRMGVEFVTYQSRTMPEKNWSRDFSAILGLFARYHTDKINFNGVRSIGRNRYAWLPEPYLSLSYSHEGQNMFKLDYKLQTSAPDALNLIDVEFTSDPLNIRMGNPNLKNEYHHKIEFQYYAQNWASSQGINLAFIAGYSVWHNGTSMGYTYNPDLGVRYYKPENVNGNWWSWIYANFGFPITHDKKLTMNTYTRFDFNDNADMVDVEGMMQTSKRIVHSTQFMEIMNLNYSIGKSKIGAMGRVHTRHSTSSAVNFRTINAVEFRYGLTGLIKMPYDIELSTDLTMYSRRGYSNRSMNTDDLVWNASLSKGVMNNNLTFTIEAFDILHQLSNIRYELNGMGRTETWVNCIPRYLMFKARYRLNIQPRKRN